MENEYIIQTPDGKEWPAVMYQGKLAPPAMKRLRRGKGFCCKCTGETDDTSTPFETKISEGKLECHLCGKILKIIKTPADFQKEEAEKQKRELENLHVVEVNYSWESGIKLCALSTRIPPHEWKKVAHLFSFWKATPGNEDECDDEEWCDYYVGYATRQPTEVERILEIPEKNCLHIRREIQKKD